MKGQISFEFYFALFIFAIFTTYIIFQVTSATPNYQTQLQAQDVKLNAYRVSELLVDDNGSPINWQNNIGNINRLGLSDETKNLTNMLSTAKISAFSSICSSNYATVLQNLTLSPSTQLIVNIVDITTNQVEASCNPPLLISKNTPIVNVTRIVALSNGDYASLTVTMW